ncbi:uncharacterized protein LOC143909556 [Arctopsyche grandis]|uniref:uncharacterized protein LOC143909556 n=1 Tax=Arctopsyche grandis TaxID=121162 RepID=UPI00406DA32F
MECRLCLCSTPVESSVSIHDSLHPLAQRIWDCCRLQVRKDDNLPNFICRSCESKLEMLINFKNICIHNNETRKLTKCLVIKSEEVILDDLMWENENDIDSLPNVCNTSVINEASKWESNASKQGDLIENADSLVHGKEICSSNNDISLEKLPSMNTLYNIKSYNTECKSRPLIKESTLFKCNICSKSFACKNAHTRHFKSHTRKKSYKCDICLKSFISKRNLVEHINCHSEIKPHKCDTCSKSFNSKSSYNKHLKTHTEGKRYKCELCLKTFSRKFVYTRHLKIHTGIKLYKCEICSKSVNSKTSFTEHMNSHNGIKPHQCTICSKSFARKYTLIAHVNFHNGIKPHECEICLKTFHSQSSFRTHVKLNHT